MPNPLIIFDITGPCAMFRKFYTNSSSLSYPFPPRSTLAGLIAGLMGYDRNSYSEDLSPNKCKIAVSVRAPVRRVMQTVNYLMTKSPSNFDGSAGGTQIPIEWIFPAIKQNKLHYRVYVTHKDVNWLRRLSKIIKNGDWHYPPYLGLTECIAQISYVTTLTEWHLATPEGPIKIVTVVPAIALASAPELEIGAQIIKERIPISLNHDRKIEAISDVLYERTGRGITAQINQKTFLCFYTEDDKKISEFGVFLA